MKSYLKLVSLITIAALASCSAPKKVPYMVDAETIPSEVLNQLPQSSDPIIVPGDLLNINVTSSDMTSVLQFNKGQFISPDGKPMSIQHQTQNNLNSADAYTDYYLVDSNGDIDFPIIGKIHVLGLTKQQVAAKILADIYPKYVKVEPQVDIRLMNFRVTVAGQVKNPGVYQSKNERMNLLEALAMAGDLDIKGERENIMLIRTNPDGKRQVVRLNLHDKNVLLSPYFNLQQNDYIYVQPNKSAASNAWSLNPSVGATITIVGGLSSLAGLVIGIINLTDKK